MMISALYIQMQESSMVPIVGIMLATAHLSYKTALQAVSSLITEKRKNGLCMSFPYETIQGQNISLEPSQIEIWANDPLNQNKRFTLSPSAYNYSFPFLISCSFRTYKSFLHACTPERRTRALAHLFKQSKHGQAQHPTKHILQKMLEVLKCWVTKQAVQPVNRTAQNTSESA